MLTPGLELQLTDEETRLEGPWEGRGEEAESGQGSEVRS